MSGFDDLLALAEQEESPEVQSALRMVRPFLPLLSADQKETILESLREAMNAMQSGDKAALWATCKGLGPMGLPAFNMAVGMMDRDAGR